MHFLISGALEPIIKWKFGIVLQITPIFFNEYDLRNVLIQSFEVCI